MSGELTKLYKVIQPVVFSVRREIGELLELTAEEAEHLAAFIVPADEVPQNTSTDESSEQQSSDQTQNQNTDQNQNSDQSQNTDQSQQPQNTNQNEQPSNTEGGSQSGDQTQQTA